MKSILAALALTSALVAPGLAMARPVTLTATLNNYGGDGAYLALYVTDADGAYAGTVWMAGGGGNRRLARLPGAARHMAVVTGDCCGGGQHREGGHCDQHSFHVRLSFSIIRGRVPQGRRSHGGISWISRAWCRRSNA